MKKWITNLSIRNKVLLIVGVNILSLFSATVVAFIGLSKINDLKDDIVVYGQALSLHQSNDMMHDGIRGDFQKSYNIDSTDTNGWQEFMGEFNEHVQLFSDNFSEISKLTLDPTTAKQFGEAKAPIFDYLNYAKQIITDRSKGLIDYKSEDGKAKAEGFNKRFFILEKAMGDFTVTLNTVILNKQIVASEYVKSIKFSLGTLVACIVLFSLLLSLYIIKLIVTPVVLTEEVLGKLSLGEIPTIEKVNGKDETARMLNSLNSIVDNLVNVKEFVTEVGNGNFETEVSVFNNQGAISDSLNKMKVDLKNTAEEDKKRAWATEGMATFGDILRNTDNDLSILGNKIISNLVKYLGANQGGIFVINDNNPKERYLDLIACYAWDKTKHINQRVNEGEGLIGQAWQEADVIHLTEVPQDFVKITSGLGGENPKSVIIVPLTVNDVTYGVIELASFSRFPDFQIDFLKKIAESIASTISSAKINERTKILLEQSQMQAEQMRAQEEEMRQNMEEMQATSEEAERKAMNYETAIARLNSEINELNNKLNA